MSDRPDLDRFPELRRGWERRQFLRAAAAGTAFMAAGGALLRLAGDDLTRKARAETRPDGRPRLPPGQRVIESLRPMGGDEGSPDVRRFRLRVHGVVAHPFVLDYAALLELPQVTREADVHCVTGWSMLGGKWKGVPIALLADKAGMKSTARYLILEGAHGYTANVPIHDGLSDHALVTYRLDGKPLSIAHGAPVRGLIPDLYFWKSAKWLTGLKFVERDEPGYWEHRGYHNHGDPWREQRYG